MGRKSKLTEERQARLCEALRAGNTRAAAADYAGIGERTLYRWISRAEDEGEGPYWLLWQDIKKAEAAAEVRNVAIIQQAAKKSWQAAAWWLERRRPGRWALRQPESIQREEIVVDLVSKDEDKGDG